MSSSSAVAGERFDAVLRGAEELRDRALVSRDPDELCTITIEANARWRAVRDFVLENPEWRENPQLQRAAFVYGVVKAGASRKMRITLRAERHRRYGDGPTPLERALSSRPSRLLPRARPVVRPNVRRVHAPRRPGVRRRVRRSSRAGPDEPAPALAGFHHRGRR